MIRARFLSDLHFVSADEARGAALLTFLRGSADFDDLYLVGDVFDFWLGHHHTLYRAYFPLLRALADLVDGGTRVHLFSGNHDPDPGGFFAGLGVAVYEGPTEIMLGGARVRLQHGDLVDPRGWHHRAVCRLARNPLARRVGRAIPAEWTWRLARGYARVGQHDYTEPLPPALLTDYLPAQARRGVDVLVMGHYHRAVHHRTLVDGRPVRFYGLGDWLAQRTWLEFDRGFRLWRQTPSGPVELGPGDHGPLDQRTST